MAFREDYSHLKVVQLDGSFECFNILDNFTDSMRDENCSGLFCYRHDIERNYSYFTFYGLTEEIPMGSAVTIDRENKVLGIEINNRLITFHLPTLKKQINEVKEARLYALRN